MNHIEHFIDGDLVSFEEENLKVYNPASGEVKSSVSIASKETVSKAFDTVSLEAMDLSLIHI